MRHFEHLWAPWRDIAVDIIETGGESTNTDFSLSLALSGHSHNGFSHSKQAVTQMEVRLKQILAECFFLAAQT